MELLARLALDMPPKKSDRSYYLLGKYMSIVFLIPSMTFAGYLLARVAEHFLHRNNLVVWGILFGIFAGLFKTVQELMQEAKREEKEKSSE